MIPVTVIVLTLNEEDNLAACLESVASWACDVLVLDSGSTDRTVEIGRRFGARIATHPFDTHARQWTRALASLPASADWVLALDADQRVTPPLREEIARVAASREGSPPGPAGCYVRRKQIFRGRWIRHGGYYPKYLLKLFRRSLVWVDEGDLVDHHFRVRGPVVKLRGDLVEDNRNEADISVWIAKHDRYAALQARQELATGGAERIGVTPSLLGHPDERVAWLKGIWARLPLYLRPCLYFVYRYVVRLGFLDGKEGFVFHVLQGFWYRLLVDIKLDELRRAAPPAAREGAGGK